MFSWLAKNDRNPRGPEVFANVVEGLKKIYNQKVLPLEEAYNFHDFHDPQLHDPDFRAKPMVLLVGQYSTGKTTFIRFLLDKDFPGIRIGPEPTTDRFIAVMQGDKEGIIPGNALVVDPTKQFQPLSSFGNAFLNRLQCSTSTADILQHLTIVDSPGILSGQKQRVDRGYDFTAVLEWFASRADRIILLFDAHQLDISDEFRKAIEAFKGHDDKIRVVLNKADSVDHKQLMRVYGALMWSLSRVLQTPEVSRVYVGSFWDQPLRYDSNRKWFEEEQYDLFSDLESLPRDSVLRKLNDVIKRARLAKVHAHIIGCLKRDMPSTFGRDSKKKELVKNLDVIYDEIQREEGLPIGDFPDLKKMQDRLMEFDFMKLHYLNPRLLKVVDAALKEDITTLMAMIPQEQLDRPNGSSLAEAGNIFDVGKGEGADVGAQDQDWIVNKERHKADEIFSNLNPQDGKLTGVVAKKEMVKSKLPSSMLSKIWKLSDVDKDGMLDGDEFALAMYLINLKLEGHEIPSSLPEHLIPLSKRSYE